MILHFPLSFLILIQGSSSLICKRKQIFAGIFTEQFIFYYEVFSSYDWMGRYHAVKRVRHESTNQQGYARFTTVHSAKKHIRIVKSEKMAILPFFF